MSEVSIDISASVDDTELRVAQIMAIIDGADSPLPVIHGVLARYCPVCGGKVSAVDRDGNPVCADCGF